jgi:hypothetical protein
MRASRERIATALQTGGAIDLEAIAQDIYARAQLRSYDDPSHIVLALDYELHRPTQAPYRACVDGRLMIVRWDPDEWKLNTFIGLAIAAFGEAGISATDDDVFRLARALAVRPGRPLPSLPDWFVRAHRRSLGFSTGSGVFLALSRAMP